MCCYVGRNRFADKITCQQISRYLSKYIYIYGYLIFHLFAFDADLKSVSTFAPLAYLHTNRQKIPLVFCLMRISRYLSRSSYNIKHDKYLLMALFISNDINFVYAIPL